MLGECFVVGFLRIFCIQCKQDEFSWNHTVDEALHELSALFNLQLEIRPETRGYRMEH
jgi:hypothetical protein